MLSCLCARLDTLSITFGSRGRNPAWAGAVKARQPRRRGCRRGKSAPPHHHDPGRAARPHNCVTPPPHWSIIKLTPPDWRNCRRGRSRTTSSWGLGIADCRLASPPGRAGMTADRPDEIAGRARRAERRIGTTLRRAVVRPGTALIDGAALDHLIDNRAGADIAFDELNGGRSGRLPANPSIVSPGNLQSTGHGMFVRGFAPPAAPEPLLEVDPAFRFLILHGVCFSIKHDESPDFCVARAA